MSIGGWIAGRVWQIAAGAAGIAGIAASAYLGIQLLDARGDLRDERHTTAELRLTNTQLTVDLTQARTNAITAQTALDQQNGQLRTLSAQSIAALATTGKLVDSANKQVAIAERQAGGVISYMPQGDTTCARILDIDRHFMESLK